MLAAAALAGCGGGDKTAMTATTGAATAPAPAPAPTATSPHPAAPAPHAAPPATTSPSGNGGTAPAGTDVELVGRGGDVKPARVNVAPFVAVRVTLRSADGMPYVLRVAGHRLAAGGGAGAGHLTLPGLRPNGSYTLVAAPEAKVVISASGEPGP